MTFHLVHAFLKKLKEKDDKFKESDFDALTLVVQIFTWGTDKLNKENVGIVNECMEEVDSDPAHATLLGQAVDALLVMIAVAPKRSKEVPKHTHKDTFYDLNMRVFLYTNNPNMVWKEDVVKELNAMFQ
jgi:hypothetical protein